MGLFLVFPSITFREGRNVVLYVGRELIQFLIQPCCVTLVGQYFVKCINYLTLKCCDADVQYFLERCVACISKGYMCVSITEQWLDESLVVLQSQSLWHSVRNWQSGSHGSAWLYSSVVSPGLGGMTIRK